MIAWENDLLIIYYVYYIWYTSNQIAYVRIGGGGGSRRLRTRCVHGGRGGGQKLATFCVRTLWMAPQV